MMCETEQRACFSVRALFSFIDTILCLLQFLLEQMLVQTLKTIQTYVSTLNVGAVI